MTEAPSNFLLSAALQLPAHCEWSFPRSRPPPCAQHATQRGSQVKGKWQLKLSEPTGDASLRCGHDVPDKVMTAVDNNVSLTWPASSEAAGTASQPLLFQHSLVCHRGIFDLSQIHWDNPGFEVAREATMMLEDPQTLSGSDGAGKWTMTYDEGFDFSMGDNSVSLLWCTHGLLGCWS